MISIGYVHLVNPAAVGKFVIPSSTNGAVDYIYEVLRFLETHNKNQAARRSEIRSEMWGYFRSERNSDSEGVLYKAAKVKADYRIN